ncbi:bifunctional phosphopantothenoylcysteine decarboxylase/phosphopantothenate--cysteine ligase CoaBC [Hyphomicrobium sp.]|uniref:bifunctional phosphopantothenoylcysteine decarboxylase/phosphopantothenate--cysteine ligase CoaBC n=1 Tax=Hyphomicrobium sp. TaxID=82 RepID=UPI002CD57A3F|nr:bifunctional phosphopantothenoylcysteine decarboxylase/phosphopantothenate--cysteine ligase CoaBC [Hyphomicrobium sp.]HVZ05919.1 bifunctional phosphopantothenoylcysteine decarboxylase/phosphopantothenate--cysteine ligase CoaBC [Hyphomicrobium sp.]
MSSAKRILLIIGGGIAAYKCLDLIRRLRERGYHVRAVLTKAAQHFVTPLSVAALTNERAFTDLFDLDDEREIGHIRLARDPDLIVVAPATADLIARMAGGHADDLATAILLATDKPVLVAPAMNPHMWLNPATRRNVEQLKRDGRLFVGPAIGEMAERGEAGPGRLAEVPDLLAAVESALDATSDTRPDRGPLAGRHVIVTSGPTHEPIDPVRYLANRSSGKQGQELAIAAANLGADVTLISGPVSLPPPAGIHVVRVTTASEMLEAVEAALPADIAIFAAAVADWRIAEPHAEKMKKSATGTAPNLKLSENPDILKTVAHRKKNRPDLVIGFAAETGDILAHAKKKLKSKGADWIVANDVSPQTGVMGGERNTIHLLTDAGIESWPEMSKADVAAKIVDRAARRLVPKRAAAE